VLGPVLATKPRHWEATLDASARSLLGLTQRAVPLMSGGWGRIISITSEGGQKVVPGYGVVGVAKAALESLTRRLAVELARQGILVNGVQAGLADTKSFRSIPGAEAALKEARRRTPTGRVVTPEDVARVVTFLASGEAQMIVGQFIVVDGGRAILA
jgi:enoyl-[acyl-carrier protein] reductase III